MNKKKMPTISRRNLCLILAFVPPWLLAPATAKPTDAQIARNRFVESIPVLPWLTLGETTINQARVPIQRLKTDMGGSLLIREGESVETGGKFIHLATALKQGMLNEQGMQMLTLDFDARNKLQMAVFWINRGWNDKNLAPFVARMSSRYATLAIPDHLYDPESEATDKIIIFEIGKYVIELRLPQHGTYATATFTTKEILGKLRSLDGTIHLYGESLGN